MNDLIVHQINIAHYRLVELAKLADQAKPFYDWIEKHAKMVTGSHKSLNDIIFESPKKVLKEVILNCYGDGSEEKPLLFDGIGRVYPHSKACFYFFAWIIRDAPQQRLTPLIARMQKADNVSRVIAEIDSLVELLFEYRKVVKNFEWPTVREIVIDRLEGSRRSISGHHVENYVRTSLVTAIQNFYSIYNNYGTFKKVEIADKQMKVGRHTIDVSARLFPKHGDHPLELLIPVKTRETEGGGHSHIFSRDILAAVADTKRELTNYHIIVVIVAENWSISEIETITGEIDSIFHFNMSPNRFVGFDDKSQIDLNKRIEKILKGEE